MKKPEKLFSKTSFLKKVKGFRFSSNVKLILGLFAFAALFLVLYRFVFVAAVVNGRPVSKIKYFDELHKLSGGEVIQNLIEETLIKQEAKKLGIKVTNEDIDAEITLIEAALSQQGFTLQQALDARGQTMATLRDQITLKKMIEGALAGEITISEDEIKVYFDQNRDYFEEGATLEELKADIEDQIYQQKLTDVYLEWIAEIKAASKIRYFVDVPAN